MIAEFGEEELWLPLLRALRHKSVPAGERLPALRIIASPDVAPPPSGAWRFLREIESNPPVDEADPFFGASNEQLGVAWLRLVLVHRIVSAEQLRMKLTKYSAATDLDVRSEVASTCGAAIRVEHRQEWIVSLLLQLSEDVSGSVRHHAARGLATASAVTSLSSETVRDRVLELLADPGISAPLGVLMGLGDVTNHGGELPAWYGDHVRRLSVEHTSMNVRRAAKAALQGGF